KQRTLLYTFLFICYGTTHASFPLLLPPILPGSSPQSGLSDPSVFDNLALLCPCREPIQKQRPLALARYILPIQKSAVPFCHSSTRAILLPAEAQSHVWHPLGSAHWHH